MPTLAALLLCVTCAQETEPMNTLPDAEVLLAKYDALRVPKGGGEPPRFVRMEATIATDVVEKQETGDVLEVYDGMDRAKITVSHGTVGTSTMGMQGAMSWSTDAALGVTIREGDEGASVRRLFRIARRALWREIYRGAETVAAAEVEDTPCFQLRMVAEGEAHDTWYLDANGHLLRADLSLPNPTGGQLEMEFYYSDFREVDGVTYPFRRAQKVGEFELVYDFLSIAHPETMAPEDLAPGKEILAAWKDPSKRKQTAPSGAGTYEIRTAEVQTVVSVRISIPENEISKHLGIMFGEVMTYLSKEGIVPTGPPFSRTHSNEDGQLDFEAGIPVREAVPGEGRVKSSELPGGKLVSTWHVGPYDSLGQTHDRFVQWLSDEQHELRGGLWAVYWTDPGLEPNPAEWKTEILAPIR